MKTATRATTLLDDLTRHLTAEEKAQLATLLELAADRANEKSEWTVSRVDARASRERSTRLLKGANYLADTTLDA